MQDGETSAIISGAAKPARRMRILVVDDESAARRVVRRAYETGPAKGDGVSVLEATSVEEALRVLADGQVDAIILDLSFPGTLQGRNLLERLYREGAGIPILVVTGSAPTLTDMFRLGAADVLCKPFQIWQLRSAVKQVLAAAEATRQPSWACARARVLHVEDEDDWAELVRMWLARTDYASYRVAGRTEMVRFLRASRELPDCIVLDLSLSDADGLSVCEQIKADVRLSAIPVVVYSARGDDRLEAIRRRAVQTVLKPVLKGGLPDELLAVLDSVIEQQERTRGVLVKAGLRLDPRDRSVRAGGVAPIELEGPLFALFRLLLERAPYAVPDVELRQACLQRGSYRRHHADDPSPRTIANYVSALRASLGPAIGGRFVSVSGGGYAYEPT